jgi:hypothetical protein
MHGRVVTGLVTVAALLIIMGGRTQAGALRSQDEGAVPTDVVSAEEVAVFAAFLEGEYATYPVPVAVVRQTTGDDAGSWTGYPDARVEKLSERVPSVAQLKRKYPRLQPLDDALNDALAARNVSQATIGTIPTKLAPYIIVDDSERTRIGSRVTCTGVPIKPVEFPELPGFNGLLTVSRVGMNGDQTQAVFFWGIVSGCLKSSWLAYLTCEAGEWVPLERVQLSS